MDLSQTIIRNVLRWAVRLSVYKYTCIHIKGPDNVWPDLLGRSSAPTQTIRRVVHVPDLVSSVTPKFDWNTIEELLEAQEGPEDRPKILSWMLHTVYGKRNRGLYGPQNSKKICTSFSVLSPIQDQQDIMGLRELLNIFNNGSHVMLWWRKYRSLFVDAFTASQKQEGGEHLDHLDLRCSGPNQMTSFNSITSSSSRVK